MIAKEVARQLKKHLAMVGGSPYVVASGTGIRQPNGDVIVSGTEVHTYPNKTTPPTSIRYNPSTQVAPLVLNPDTKKPMKKWTLSEYTVTDIPAADTSFWLEIDFNTGKVVIDVPKSKTKVPILKPPVE